jgi:hypothetical protein
MQTTEQTTESQRTQRKYIGSRMIANNTQNSLQFIQKIWIWSEFSKIPSKPFAFRKNSVDSVNLCELCGWFFVVGS